MKNSWQKELQKFNEMSLYGKITWLSNLIYLISSCARNAYEVGNDNIEKQIQLRQYNELIHRIASFQKDTAQRKKSYPVDVIFELIHESLVRIGVGDDFILEHLEHQVTTENSEI